MSAASVAVSVEEYLSSVYRPDCDYIDGEVVERNVGEFDHSWMQTAIGWYLFVRGKLWGITALTELRVQVNATRFRVPDITVIANPVTANPEHKMRILREPPLLCVEILSPEDRMVKVQAGVEDYLSFGVPCVWIVNPETRQGFVCTPDGMVEAKDGVLRVVGTAIEVPLAELG
jgi:Uma2 family endonuclease